MHTVQKKCFQIIKPFQKNQQKKSYGNSQLGFELSSRAWLDQARQFGHVFSLMYKLINYIYSLPAHWKFEKTFHPPSNSSQLRRLPRRTMAHLPKHGLSRLETTIKHHCRKIDNHDSPQLSEQIRAHWGRLTPESFISPKTMAVSIRWRRATLAVNHRRTFNSNIPTGKAAVLYSPVTRIRIPHPVFPFL